jgi:hypothetical protein
MNHCHSHNPEQECIYVCSSAKMATPENIAWYRKHKSQKQISGICVTLWALGLKVEGLKQASTHLCGILRVLLEAFLKQVWDTGRHMQLQYTQCTHVRRWAFI